nr:unnamed protein product [Callosobruchus analis]
MEIKHLREVAAQRDKVIANQSIAIETLQNYNNLLNIIFDGNNQDNKASMLMESVPSTGNQANYRPTSGNKVPDYRNVVTSIATMVKPVPEFDSAPGKSMAKSLSTNNLTQVNPITTQQVAAAIHQVSAEQTVNRVASLDDQNDGYETKRTESEEWKKVEYRRRKQNVTVVGTGEVSTMKASIKAVPSLEYYHVFNLHPSTLCENVTDFLKHEFPEVTCSQLTSKHPERYASFKVGIYNSNVNSFLEPTSYPANSIV